MGPVRKLADDEADQVTMVIVYRHQAVETVANQALVVASRAVRHARVMSSSMMMMTQARIRLVIAHERGQVGIVMIRAIGKMCKKELLRKIESVTKIEPTVQHREMKKVIAAAVLDRVATLSVTHVLMITKVSRV